MVEAAWEKPKNKPSFVIGREGIKFVLAGLILLGAITYLIVTGTMSGARYFLTVDELVSNPEYIGQSVRITGAVVGETIEYDSANLILDFEIAYIPNEVENLALALHQAVSDPTATRLVVHLEDEVMPDLLQHEAQAIVTGILKDDGIFYASELLLKCPTRYEEAAPGQSIGG